MDLQKIVSGYITNTIAEKIGAKVGLSPEISKMIAAKAIPLFLGGMANNAAKDEQSAAGLFGAITKDHDGSIFNNLDGLLGDTKALKGDKILAHVLGNKEQAVEAALAADSGVKTGQAKDFMQAMGPLVMGALGKEQTNKHLEADHLAKMFAHEKQTQTKQQAANPLLSLLDKEGDGVADDLLKMGMSFLNKS